MLLQHGHPGHRTEKNQQQGEVDGRGRCPESHSERGEWGRVGPQSSVFLFAVHWATTRTGPLPSPWKLAFIPLSDIWKPTYWHVRLSVFLLIIYFRLHNWIHLYIEIGFWINWDQYTIDKLHSSHRKERSLIKELHSIQIEFKWFLFASRCFTLYFI